MKKIKIILIIFSISFLTTSCKKCITCEIKFKSASGKSSLKIMDDCARKKKLKDFEKSAKQVADSLNGTVLCVTE